MELTPRSIRNAVTFQAAHDSPAKLITFSLFFSSSSFQHRQRRKNDKNKKITKREKEETKPRTIVNLGKLLLHFDREVSFFDSNLFAIFLATWTRLGSREALSMALGKKFQPRREARYRINWQFLIHRLTSSPPFNEEENYAFSRTRGNHPRSLRSFPNLARFTTRTDILFCLVGSVTNRPLNRTVFPELDDHARFRRNRNYPVPEAETRL